MKKIILSLSLLVLGLGCNQPAPANQTSDNTAVGETATYLVPTNIEEYRQKMTEFSQAGGENPLPKTEFVRKQIDIQVGQDPIRTVAETAAKAVYKAGGGPAEITVDYLTVDYEGTAYVQLNIDISAWAGVSVAQAIVHPVVEKNLLQYTDIKKVVFSRAKSVFSFSHDCPDGWVRNQNLDYGGEVGVSECTLVYPDSGQYSFDSGISVGFSFVPEKISQSHQDNGFLYIDTQMNNVKKETNAKSYARNGFSGWMSGKNSAHSLTIFALRPAPGGNYEVEVMAMGEQKTEAEFLGMANQIIDSFKVE